MAVYYKCKICGEEHESQIAFQCPKTGKSESYDKKDISWQMDKFVAQRFLKEIETQCRFAEMAYEDTNHALQSHDTDRVFFAAHALLVAVGNVSKLLWPAKEIHEDRGKELRKILGVRGNCPVKSRDFRNHFEHFDERLEVWARSSKHKNFVDFNIGSVSGIASEDIMRNYDPTSETLTFHGGSYPLCGTMGALRRICTAAQRESQRLAIDMWR